MLRYVSSLVECNTEVCYKLGVEPILRYVSSLVECNAEVCFKLGVEPILRYVSSLVECNTEVCYELGVEPNACVFSLHGSYYIHALFNIVCCL